MIKNTKGITLVALVITVIVLLILASVTIAMALGNNGIINRAKEASDKYESSADDENKTLNNLDSEADDILSRSGIYLDDKELSE